MEAQESVGLVRFNIVVTGLLTKIVFWYKSNGEISVIRQIVDEKDTVLTLSKLK